MLIGHSIEPDIAMAAAGAGVSVYLYDFAEPTYTFQFGFANIHSMPHQMAEEYSYGYIGEAMRASYAAFAEGGAF